MNSALGPSSKVIAAFGASTRPPPMTRPNSGLLGVNAAQASTSAVSTAAANTRSPNSPPRATASTAAPVSQTAASATKRLMTWRLPMPVVVLPSDRQ